MDIIPDYVGFVLDTLHKNGYNACLVGGCVRDMLLGRPIHDWDAATSALTAEVRDLFDKTVETGARFGTVTVVLYAGNVEVTTFRSDGDYSDGRRPDGVAFVTDLREDLQRRDFTINAMAMDLDRQITDLFDGRGDLERRLIRCVGDPEARFGEDALRMFRALRFSAQLGFRIEPETLAAIRKCAPTCAGLSAERVRDETEKMLLSDAPSLVADAIRLGLFTDRIVQTGRPLFGLSRLKLLPKQPLLRWSALCAVLCDLSLIGTPETFLTDMRLDAKTVRSASAGVRAAMASPLPHSSVGIKRLIANKGPDAALCAAAADTALHGTQAVNLVEQVLSGNECYALKDLAVTGNDLIECGFKKGVALGKALKDLLEHVIEHPEDNTRDCLLARVAMLKNKV